MPKEPKACGTHHNAQCELTMATAVVSKGASELQQWLQVEH
jgi:hypothetical protein